MLDGLAKSQMLLFNPQESGCILLAQRKNSAARSRRIGRMAKMETMAF